MLGLLGVLVACAANDPADSFAHGTADDTTTDDTVGTTAPTATSDNDATTASSAATTDAATTIDATTATTEGGPTTSNDATGDTGTSGDNVLFFDDFDRDDTVDGLDNGWIVNVKGGSPPSAFHIDANQAYPFFGEVLGSQLFHSSPSAFRPDLFDQSQIRVSVDVVTVDGSYNGVVALFARSQVTSNEILDTYWCGFLAAATNLYLGKMTDGAFEALDMTAPGVLPLPQDSTSRLSLTIDGDELTCEISGAVEHTLTAVDTTFESGYFGMDSGKPDQNTVRFDDFLLETL